MTPIGKRKRSKHLTIPRLELLAILLGVRGGKFVVKELGLEVAERFLFSDSQCVLYWLKRSKSLPENRVKETVKEKDVTFRFIESAHNPADVATRG